MGYYDVDYDSAAFQRHQAKQRERERIAKERAHAERSAAIDARIRSILPAIEAENVPAMWLVSRLLAEKHRITIETRDTMPSGAAAYAQWHRRTVVVPPIIDVETFAIVLHEKVTFSPANVRAASRIGPIRTRGIGITASDAKWTRGKSPWI